jgi:hypothetical protein
MNTKIWVCRPLASYAIFAVCTLLVDARSAHALPLPPGATIPAVATPTQGGFPPIADSGAVAFSAPTFSGTLTSRVSNNDPFNMLGGLTFTYVLTNDTSSANSIGRFTIDSFAGFLTDVAYFGPPGGFPGTVPAFVDRGAGSGDVVGFTFFSQPFGDGKLAPGAASAVLVVQTNAQSFAPTLAGIINGSATSAFSYAPVAVPEPSTIALLVLGGLLMLGRRILAAR